MTRTTILGGQKRLYKIIFAFQNVAEAAGATRYFGVNHAGMPNTSESYVTAPFSSPGTFKNLRVNLSMANGADKTTTVTLRKNEADTAITCSVTNNTSCSDLTHEVLIATGDKMNFSVFLTTAGAAATLAGTIEFYPLQ